MSNENRILLCVGITIIIVILCLITAGCYWASDDQEYLKTVYPDKVIYKGIGTDKVYAICDSSGKLHRLAITNSIIDPPKIYDITPIK